MLAGADEDEEEEFEIDLNDQVGGGGFRGAHASRFGLRLTA